MAFDGSIDGPATCVGEMSKSAGTLLQNEAVGDIFARCRSLACTGLGQSKTTQGSNDPLCTQNQSDVVFIIIDLMTSNAREVVELSIDSIQQRLGPSRETSESIWQSEM